MSDVDGLDRPRNQQVWEYKKANWEWNSLWEPIFVYRIVHTTCKLLAQKGEGKIQFWNKWFM
jgi:hypothetical protein